MQGWGRALFLMWGAVVLLALAQAYASNMASVSDVVEGCEAPVALGDVETEEDPESSEEQETDEKFSPDRRTVTTAAGDALASPASEIEIPSASAHAREVFRPPDTVA